MGPVNGRLGADDPSLRVKVLVSDDSKPGRALRKALRLARKEVGVSQYSEGDGTGIEFSVGYSEDDQTYERRKAALYASVARFSRLSPIERIEAAIVRVLDNYGRRVEEEIRSGRLERVGGPHC